MDSTKDVSSKVYKRVRIIWRVLALDGCKQAIYFLPSEHQADVNEVFSDSHRQIDL